MRAKDEGSIYQRRDGRWVASVNLPRLHGKRRRLEAYCDSQGDAVPKLEELRQEARKLAAGTPQDGTPLTLSQYATRWFAELDAAAACGDLKARTTTSYQWLLRAYVLDTLGTKTLTAITAHDIRQLLNTLRLRYSKNTTRLARSSLSACFADAVTAGLVESNPALAARTGRGHRGGHGMSAADRTKAIRPFDEAEVARLLDAARDDGDYHTLLMLLARTGMRPSEAYGLRWDDISYERRQILVERGCSMGRLSTPKTGLSRRVDLSAALATELRSMHLRRERDIMAGRFPQPPLWVFCNSQGGNLDESRTRKHFARAMKRANLSGHRLYDLRHSFASILLSHGAPITYVAAQMGHARPTVTLQFYSHWLPRADTTYVDGLDTPVTAKAAVVG